MKTNGFTASMLIPGIAALVLCGAPVLATDFTFVGGSLGSGIGVWNQPSDWSPLGGPPSTNDRATIASGKQCTITNSSGQDVTCKKLTVGGTLIIESDRTVTITNENYGRPGTSADLRLQEVTRGAGPPPGFEIVDIIGGFDWTQPPKINNCGQAAINFVPGGEADGEIFVYDNGRLIRITDNDRHESVPDINDLGQVVWARLPDPPGLHDIVLYADGRETVIGRGYAPDINNLVHLGWHRKTYQGCDLLDSEIDYDNGQTITQLTNEGRNNQGTEINDSDQIVWTAINWCNIPWTSQIMLYSDGIITQLTAEQDAPRGVCINNQSVVAWFFNIPFGNDGIEVWEDGKTTLLTDWGILPRLNNLGDIYFLRWYEENSTWQGWIYYHTGKFHQLTDDPYWNTDGEINDAGEIVWIWSDALHTQAGYRFMRRIRTGDGDLDGDIDLDDYAMFVNCVTGPEWVELTNPGPEDSLCECRFLDIDHDGDVDFADFAIFQINFAASN